MNSDTQSKAFWLRGAAVVACCAVCMCLASCAWPLSTTPSSPPVSVRAGDDQNGTSIKLYLGQTLMVTLSSTYWSFQGSSDSQVLASVGSPIVSPAHCDVPGCGAGTVSEEFRAVGPGMAQVTASRVSCGEAMRCTGANGRYQLTVQVIAASQ
ncbi:MAG TPA: hypothetical protein VF510_11030 [Ktedonobacterales bacterium]